MKTNQLRALLAEGRTVYGTMIQEVRNASVAQIMAHAGCDFFFVDCEHGPFSLETVADMVRVARLSDITPLVRVPDAQYHLIARILDLGAQGIMVPRVETRAQVEYIVQSALYPPLGQRGCSVNKGHNDLRSENEWLFTEAANRENLIILQIERGRAVEDIDDLLSVSGVGAALIGPNDMALSLGVRAPDQLAALEAPIQRVLDACRAHGLPCGIHIANLEWLARWQQRGMQLLCYSSDLNFLEKGAASAIGWLRDKAGSGT